MANFVSSLEKIGLPMVLLPTLMTLPTEFKNMELKDPRLNVKFVT